MNEYLAIAPVSDITHYMYQSLLIDMDKRGYAHSTISGVNTRTNMIFKHAKRNKLIKDNPREDAVVTKKKISIEDLEEDNINEIFFKILCDSFVIVYSKSEVFPLATPVISIFI